MKTFSVRYDTASHFNASRDLLKPRRERQTPVCQHSYELEDFEAAYGHFVTALIYRCEECGHRITCNS